MKWYLPTSCQSTSFERYNTLLASVMTVSKTSYCLHRERKYAARISTLLNRVPTYVKFRAVFTVLYCTVRRLDSVCSLRSPSVGAVCWQTVNKIRHHRRTESFFFSFLPLRSSTSPLCNSSFFFPLDFEKAYDSVKREVLYNILQTTIIRAILSFCTPHILRVSVWTSYERYVTHVNTKPWKRIGDAGLKLYAFFTLAFSVTFIFIESFVITFSC
jgi:hypothetical protein